MIHFLGGAIVVAIFSYMIYRQYTPEYRAEMMLRSEGVVIEKVADPAGYDWGFWEGDIVYRPDRYYLKVRLDNGDVTELKVDAVTYMHTNVGDRVKNR
jgi:hypothetical protein